MISIRQHRPHAESKNEHTNQTAEDNDIQPSGSGSTRFLRTKNDLTHDENLLKKNGSNEPNGNEERTPFRILNPKNTSPTRQRVRVFKPSMDALAGASGLYWSICGAIKSLNGIAPGAYRLAAVSRDSTPLPKKAETNVGRSVTLSASVGDDWPTFSS